MKLKISASDLPGGKQSLDIKKNLPFLAILDHHLRTNHLLPESNFDPVTPRLLSTSK